MFGIIPCLYAHVINAYKHNNKKQYILYHLHTCLLIIQYYFLFFLLKGCSSRTPSPFWIRQWVRIGAQWSVLFAYH